MKKLILFGCLFVSAIVVFSQQVELIYQDQPLNQVLIDMRNRYDLQLSFNDDFLSRFEITVSKQFSSPEQAFSYLLKDLPIAYEKVGEVFLFYEKQSSPAVKKYGLGGRFKDQNTQESLPYTHLMINGKGLVTDQQGSFSFTGQDTAFHLQASYLGYYFLDTIVSQGTRQLFLLQPANYSIPEIEIEGKRGVRSLQVGNNPGVLRLNHQIAQYLPGNGDNSVFNLLRLQPGILAAGEQSNDLIIWGSYEGQSQVLFDGFTLFGMKNYNDNISAVNPFMAKDIQVLKGAYGAEHGGRVGGIVNITGVDGDFMQAHLKMSINNMTLNGMLSFPVAQQSALTIAFRQTYYELYNSKQLSFSSGRFGNSRSSGGRTIYPDYTFRDLNLKYAGTNKNGDSYGISALLAEDRFYYTLDTESEQSRFAYEDHEHNKQYAASAFYQKKWWNGSRTKLQGAYSTLDKEIRNLREIGRWRQGQGGQGQGGGGSYEFSNVDQLLLNRVSEATLNLEHQVALGEQHQLKVGIGTVFNRTDFQEDSFQVSLLKQQVDGSRMNFYSEDAVSFTPWMTLKIGLRANYSFNLNQAYWQPRISSSMNLGGGFKLNLAGGLHNQFIARTTLIDQDGNYHYSWTICDDQTIPVLKSTHTVAGLTYQQDNFTFSLEGFYKETSGLSRYITELNEQTLYQGESKSQGLDFFVKQVYKKHEAWISYTLSETMERFDYFTPLVFQRALHDQRHELKAAVMLNFNPVFLSANYVFGSGFPDPRLAVDDAFEKDYKRLDVAATYQWKKKKFLLEAGVSILNVLDYYNLKYANFIVLPDEQDVSVNLYAESIPFTPTVFLNFSF